MSCGVVPCKWLLDIRLRGVVPNTDCPRRNVNLRAAFLCSKYAIQQFLKQNSSTDYQKRGCIINMASAAGLREVKMSGELQRPSVSMLEFRSANQPVQGRTALPKRPS